MTTRTAVAAGAGALVLAVGGLATANQLDIVPLSATETTTETVALPPPVCTANTSRGVVADACVQELALWQQSYRNALPLMPYYAKWKAANPGEYGRLRTWSTSIPTTPEPTMNTAFGATVRYALNQCRTWAIDIANCLLP